MNGEEHSVAAWDMIIAFPPCTYLTVTGNRWFRPEYYKGQIDLFGDSEVSRADKREDAREFFMKFANAPCERIAIENPVGAMSTLWRKPDQIIQPYFFGEHERKATCLWLKGLPKLTPTEIVEPRVYTYISNGKHDSMWHVESMKLPPAERARYRSQTYLGIAKAMGNQWG